jgi:hypothetical protein
MSRFRILQVWFAAAVLSAGLFVVTGVAADSGQLYPDLHRKG